MSDAASWQCPNNPAPPHKHVWRRLRVSERLTRMFCVRCHPEALERYVPA